MDTLIKKVDAENPDESVLKEAAEIIRAGGLVAFPTETVYGLGANGLDGEACKRIYEAKGRPSDNPLILHISDRKWVGRLAREIPPAGDIIMEKFWPGPVTIVFKKTDIVPDSVSGGLDTVAVRFPVNTVAMRFLALCDVPVAAPSANSSGKPSPTRASHVEFDLSGKIDMIIDGGACEFGLESTIVDVTEDIPVLLRPGAVTFEMLTEVLGEVRVDESVFSGNAEKPKAPGMKYKHYSPLAEVILVDGKDSEEISRKINALLEKDKAEGIKSGVLTFDERAGNYQCENILRMGSENDFKEIGANLFKMLRKFDYMNVDRVYCETVPAEGEGFAIMNRLFKAAGFRTV
ncbi:MAG: threonylcarbamoyl-AMP synthase [Firmicutes bacterium]|nr:threonylcarbamoyl-AMP synthase [Bacillota bacterium]